MFICFFLFCHVQSFFVLPSKMSFLICHHLRLMLNYICVCLRIWRYTTQWWTCAATSWPPCFFVRCSCRSVAPWDTWCDPAGVFVKVWSNDMHLSGERRINYANSMCLLLRLKKTWRGEEQFSRSVQVLEDAAWLGIRWMPTALGLLVLLWLYEEACCYCWSVNFKILTVNCIMM